MNFIVCSVVGCQSEHSLWHILVLILLANIICGQTAVDWQLITISAECCVNSTTLLSSSSELLSYLCTLYDSSAGELWRSALVFFYHPIKQTCTRTRTRAQHLGLNAAASKSWFFCVCVFLCLDGVNTSTHMQSGPVFSQAWQFHALFQEGSLNPVASKIQQMTRSYRHTRTPTHVKQGGCRLQVL